MKSILNSIKTPTSAQKQTALMVASFTALVITAGALNGGTALSASAWDNLRTWTETMLTSSWTLTIALFGLIAGVWQLIHGKGYGMLGTVVGILGVALVGPGVVTTAATATRPVHAHVAVAKVQAPATVLVAQSLR